MSQPALGAWERDRVLTFLRAHDHGVVATLAPTGGPQAAVVGLAVADDLSVVFDTLETTHKAQNIRSDGRVAVTWWHDAVTLQLEGRAVEATGLARESAQATYFSAFPSGRERASWPGITWFRITPSLIRVSDFSGSAPQVTTLTFP